MKQQDVIITGRHIELTDALKTAVQEKFTKLFNHEERIIRLRVELEYDPHDSKRDEYVCKGHIEINGPPLIVSEASDDLYKSIDLAVNKLDRKLRRRSRLRRVKRKNKHAVDIPAELPKVPVDHAA